MSRYILGVGGGVGGGITGITGITGGVGYREVLLRVCAKHDGTLVESLTHAMCYGYREVVIDLITNYYVSYDNLYSAVQAGYSRGQNDLARYIEDTYLVPLHHINDDLSSRISQSSKS
jgi:hypothetical protein